MNEAITDWLGDRKNKSLEDIARKNNVNAAQFKKEVSELYTKCVDAVISYQSYSENGLSHSGAAKKKGIDFLTYVSFRRKFNVHDEKSRDGLIQAEGLKRDELYNSSISPKKKLSEDEKKIVKALHNFYNGLIAGDERGIFSYCRAEGVKELELIPNFMGKNRLGMPKDKAEAYQYIKKLDDMNKE